jgi:hypothetical protein
MAKRSKPSVLKRERERKRAEKAALKRDQRTRRDRPADGEPVSVASRSELESYGALVGPGAADDVPRRPR